MIRYEHREHKDAPETSGEWRKTTSMSVDARSKRMFWHAASMEYQRDEARRHGLALAAVLQAIAEMPEYDQDDAHRLRNIARQFLSQNSQAQQREE